VHLSGRLSDGGDPIAGQVVTVRDTVGTLVGEATTDGAGDWTLDFTATGEGGVVWVARVPATADQRAVSADLLSGVTDPTPLLEVTAPDRISPNQLITVSGRLTHHDEPLADHAISLYEECDGEVGMGIHVADTTTAVDGTFSIQIDPGACDFYSYRIVAWGDADWRYTEVKRKVVLDWRRPSMALSAVPSGPVGSPVDITATLTDQDQPVAGKPVEVWVGSRLLGTFTTDTQGEVNVDYTPGGAGTLTVFALFDGDAVSRQAWSRISVEIDRLPSTLSLAAPETISEGDDVVLTGEVGSNGAQSVEGLPVLIERTDRDGMTTQVGEATTDANGAFRLTDPQPRGGQTTYTASFTHPNFEPSTAVATVLGTMDDPVLSLAKDRGSYTAGDIAHIRVNLDTDAPRPVVVMSRSNGSTTELWRGDLQGMKELDFEPRNTSHISVQVAETDWSTYQIAKTTLPVRLLITTMAKGGYDTVNGFRLYRPAADPVFASEIDPPRFDTCLRHQLQKRVSGEWTLVRTSLCVRTDITGRSQWTLLGDQPSRTAFRTRAVFAGDKLNAATNGPWVKFKFI
jgi:hypothetical protein